MRNYFLPDENRNQEYPDDREQPETDKMPNENRGYGELRNHSVPTGARHPGDDDADQADDHCAHENRNENARDAMIRQPRQNDPPDDIQRNHQSDDGKNESHENNLRRFRVLVRRRTWRGLPAHRP